jgi:hypothetical protein
MKKKVVPVIVKYPAEEEFSEILAFINRYNPRAEGAEFHARDEITRNEYRSIKGTDAIFEIQGNLSRRKTNILDQAFPITSFARFAWVLFCKMKQRKEL